MFTLGGTIAMTRDAGGHGVTPTLRADDLVAAVPGLAESGIGIEVHDVRQLPGASLGFGDVAAVVEAIEARVTAGAIVGAVITQGTDTIEETSWLLDLLYSGQAPVVVTGAMRHPELAGADGPANLLASVQVAASRAARGLGAVVVFGDDIHAAQAVQKHHSTSVTAFASANSGPIGHVAEGEVRLWRQPTRPHVLLDAAMLLDADVRAQLDEPRVVVVPVTLGQDEALLRAVGKEDDGLVGAAFGVGHVPAAVVDVLGDLAQVKPVVLASRTGAGPVGSRTYAFPGSESELLGRGLIRAGYLDAYKARVLLHVLLAADASTSGIRQAFAGLGGYAPDEGPASHTAGGEAATQSDKEEGPR